MAEARKIAAILAADIVGFSRLAALDEDPTLARLRALRSDLIDPTIAVRNGRVFKRTGDGTPIEFRSVVDAVRCATEIQNAMIERNSGLPDGQRIALEHRDRDWRSPEAGNGTWPCECARSLELRFSLRMPIMVPAALQSTL
jgi:class 3 adenylate cyclase